MYSRNLDPRRTSRVLPEHYSGNAFLRDGTRAPIPVESDMPLSVREEIIPEEAADTSPIETSDPPKEAPIEAMAEAEEDTPDLPIPTLPPPKREEPFLSRLFDGLFPGVHEDDVLLLLLLFLLSREEGNEEILLLLGALLLIR